MNNVTQILIRIATLQSVEIPSSPDDDARSPIEHDASGQENTPTNVAANGGSMSDGTTAHQPTSITGQEKRKQISEPSNDQRFLMDLVQLQTDAMVTKLEEIRDGRHAAQRQRVKERQENSEHHEREHERDRELLRELFGRRD
ncbi:hypothetical protein PI124_g11287 [Phytophthora idaei]|nr:hypothetical protein PI125_g10752 [Phytophthora idaei]KAG3153472.1 hypothetical protein PI126_g10071 [Phytophthora idaei]KAG3243911.1 hypothetical protein PI124_g11287 [Phytophthora idaei]